MLKLKLQYFGHLMWRIDSLEKTLMQGKIFFFFLPQKEPFLLIQTLKIKGFEKKRDLWEWNPLTKYFNNQD